ncbi:helix-turn-helix domain-containing protein [Nocardia yamanashiensis]|uniref:helix-turn-helix domain-containing protein n=1 Tax=Nocardia yamanashiensis TaxID=209247 RepID=UPI00083097BE|nr:helix-turn-helix domain-containing protein [Nocardia yamanashiensis]
MTQVPARSEHRAELEKAWARWATGMGKATGRPRQLDAVPTLRHEVVESWERSLRTVDPARAVAPATDRDELGSRWAESPLRTPVTELAGELRAITEDAGMIAVVTDEVGTVLFSCGDRSVRRRAETVNLAPGGCWDEPYMGTTGVSMSLHTGRPGSVWAAEHLVEALHGWVCYCAPIRAADGRQLGVLDLSTYWDRAHPLILTTVRALVTAIESRVHVEQSRPAPRTRLECLGRPHLYKAGKPVAMRPRQLEILTLLALEPEGFTAERLREAVYGDRSVAASTLKADVSRLRQATDGQIADRRYMLTEPIGCDAVELLAALEAGDLTTAVRLYRGPLLPDSDIPGIVQWREHLDVCLRTAVLADRNPEHALRFGQRCPDDIEIHEHAMLLLPPGDSRRALAAARLHTATKG